MTLNCSCPLKPTDPSSLPTRLCYIKSWMWQNFLKPNDDKSEVILFWPQYSISISANLGRNIRHAAKNLEVIFGANFCFDDPVKKSKVFSLDKCHKLGHFYYLSTYRKLYMLLFTLGFITVMHCTLGISQCPLHHLHVTKCCCLTYFCGWEV